MTQFNHLKSTIMNSKVLLGALIAGVAAFLLGWLIFGILLMDFYLANSTEYPGLMKDSPNFVLIFVANVAWGLMLSYVFNLANIRSVRNGAISGAIIFLLTSLGIDLLYLAQMNLMNTTAIVVDVIANAFLGLIIGAILGWWFSRGVK